MIKVKITKNIIKKSKNSLGLNAKQFIIIGIAVAIAFALYFLLKNTMSFTALSTIIFVELLFIICLGIVNIQGMSLFRYFISIFKGADVRPYNSKGVFSNDISEKSKK